MKFLIISYSMANFLAGLYGFLNIRSHLRFSTPLRTKLDILKKYNDFPKFAMPAIFIDQFSRQLPVYFTSYLIATEFTGQFSLAYRMLSIPEMIIGVSIGQIFYKKLSESKEKSMSTRKMLIKVWTSLLLIGLFPFTLIFFFGEPIFSFVFGDEWQTAGNIASLLAPMLLIMFISTPASSVFTVYRSQQRSLFINIVVLLARTSTLYFGLSYMPVFEALSLYVFVEISLILLYNFVAWRLINKTN